MAKYTKDIAPRISSDWYIDSGASDHMTYFRDLFSSYVAHEQPNVKLANGTSAKVVGKEIILLTITADGQPRKFKLFNVLHVSDVGYQLHSVPTLDKESFDLTFKPRRCYIRKGSALFASATMIGNFYTLDRATTQTSCTDFVAGLRLRHKRLGHVDPAVIKALAKTGSENGISLKSLKTRQ